MKVGYAILYEDGELIISKNHTVLSKHVFKDYGEFEDTNVPWKKDCTKIEKVKILTSIKSNCMKSWFRDCENLTTLIDFQNLDVSDCRNFSCTFYNCRNLIDINSLKNCDVSNGKYFSFMFYNCKKISDISVLQRWNFKNGEEFIMLFANCKSLTNIQLSNKLKNITCSMFLDCDKNLKIYWKNHVYTIKDLMIYERL